MINPESVGCGAFASALQFVGFGLGRNLVAKYRFSVLINDIFVDEERNILCGSCSDYESTRFFKMDLLDN